MDAGRLAQRLGPDLVGRRVVVRRALPSGGRGDVLGDLVSWEGGELVLRTRDGALVRVAEADVLGGKPVPPPPAPRPRAQGPHRPGGSDQRPDDLELERVAALGWVAPESRWLGTWQLRAAEGFTGRANSVLPLGEPGLDLDAALRVVTAWYAVRGLPARVQVPLPARADLDAALAARGWTGYNPTVVMTAPLAVVPPPEGGVDLAGEPDDAWLAAYHYRGRSGLPPVARRLFTGSRLQGFASVRDGGATVAIGRVAVDAGWAGITAVEVAERARRRGLATRVLRALCAWARERGAVDAYLQVAEENAAALGLYAGAGFSEHHRYRYRLAPGVAP